MFAALPAPLLRFEMLVEAKFKPDWLDVSNDTFEKLQSFLELVVKWNPTINLISAASVSQAWKRHILDSAQLWAIANVRQGIWLDIGSGGGFPGMVMSIMAENTAPDLQTVLVESDRRKAVFLNEAARQLELGTKVICDRIENISALGATIVSARALAPLDSLLSVAYKHLTQDGIALFPQGKSHTLDKEEHDGRWKMRLDSVVSKTDPDSVILKISVLNRA